MKELKPNDRVACYALADSKEFYRSTGVVVNVYGDVVRVEQKHFVSDFHRKQVRKLVKRRQRIWLPESHVNGLNCLTVSTIAHGRLPNTEENEWGYKPGDRFVEFVEVKR